MAPVSFITIPLTLIFVTLRLCNQIHWSWWWVLAPMLIQVSIYFLGCFIIWFAERNMSEGERARRRYLEIYKR